MNISLGSITLSSNLVWRNEFKNQAVAQSVEQTLAGRTVVQHMPVIGGRTIILEATDLGDKYKGFFTRTQVQDIKALEAVQTEVTFVYGSQSIQVVVQMDGVEVHPIEDINEPGADAEYLGTVTLIEV